MFMVSLPITLLASSSVLAGDTNSAAQPDISITPIGQYVTVRGDEGRFREDWGIKEGWDGGIEDATYHQKIDKDWDMDLEGRALFDEEDYKLRLNIANPDVAFLRAGFTEFRDYSDDFGGFYRNFVPAGFELNRDLILRNGDIFVEAGITLPNVPKLTLGYERQFRQGEESLLEWGAVTQGATTRNIYPSVEHIDETVDTVKLQVEHDISIIHLGDQFRYQHYHDNTTTTDQSLNLNTSASQSVTITESYKHDAFFNTFRMDSHVNDKVYWSVGYLYTTLDGVASVGLNTVPFNAPLDMNWVAQGVDLGSDSHVVNLNTMFGPFAGLSFYAGGEAERTHSHGSGDAVLTEIAGGGVTNNPAAMLHGDEIKLSTDQTIGLRYTKIPYTTLYAEGKWTEQRYELDEESSAGTPTFQLDQNTAVMRQDYTAGFNTAPIPRVTLAARYRHSIYQNNYDDEVDTIEGYPGFITAQDFTTDEIMTKLTLRPASMLTIAFTYQLVDTDIGTSTEGVPALGTPAGSLQSGNYDSSIYSVSATLTPISRLYLTGLFSLQETRTVCFVNDNPAVTKYSGNVYSLIGSAGYALDNKTDLDLQCYYSCEEDAQNNVADGLPLGADNRRSGVTVGLTRKISKNVMARFRYGFYQLSDQANGGLDNYTAQLGSASCMIHF
jgi:hypothetical protein